MNKSVLKRFLYLAPAFYIKVDNWASCTILRWKPVKEWVYESWTAKHRGTSVLVSIIKPFYKRVWWTRSNCSENNWVSESRLLFVFPVCGHASKLMLPTPPKILCSNQMNVVQLRKKPKQNPWSTTIWSDINIWAGMQGRRGVNHWVGVRSGQLFTPTPFCVTMPSPPLTLSAEFMARPSSCILHWPGGCEARRYPLKELCSLEET